MKLRFEGPGRGAYSRALKEEEKAIARAVTTTFRQAAKEIETAARANIAGAGFSRRWQTAFRTRVTPRQFSLQPRIRGTHSIRYVNIFERGGHIPGKPLLWLPLPTAPAKIAGKKTTAALYVKTVGPLVSINRPGKPPLLAGRTARQAMVGRRVGLVSLRTGARRAAAGRRTVLVPLFVGIRQVQIRKRFNVSPIYDRVRARLGELYQQNYQREAG